MSDAAGNAAVKEEKRVAFIGKMKEGKAGLDFTLLLSDEEIADIVASLEGWNTMFECTMQEFK